MQKMRKSKLPHLIVNLFIYFLIFIMIVEILSEKGKKKKKN